MEFNKPPKNLQMRFKESPDSIKIGDVLKYVAEENGGYFINQFGWRIDVIPEGFRVRTLNTSIGGAIFSVEMPECEGLVFHKDGKTFFNMESGFEKKSILPAKFFNGDVIKIISLPK